MNNKDIIKLLDKVYYAEQLFVCKDSEFVFLPTIFTSYQSFIDYCRDNGFTFEIQALIPLTDYLNDNPELTVNDLELYYNNNVND